MSSRLWLPVDAAEAKILLLAGLMLPAVCMAGSGAGIMKFHFAAWLLGPLAMAMLIVLATCVEDLVWRCGVTMFAGAFVCTAIAAAYLHDLTDGILRDNPNRLLLLHPLQSSRLAGVFTGEARRDSFDALVRVVRHWTRPGDVVLSYGNVPMIYFATETRPLFNMPWIDIYSPSAITKIADRICTDGLVPALIVVGKAAFGDPYWGQRPDKLRIDPPPYDRIYAKLDDAAARCHFNKIFENIDFYVLAPASADPGG